MFIDFEYFNYEIFSDFFQIDMTINYKQNHVTCNMKYDYHTQKYIYSDCNTIVTIATRFYCILLNNKIIKKLSNLIVVFIFKSEK